MQYSYIAVVALQIIACLDFILGCSCMAFHLAKYIDLLAGLQLYM